MTLCSINAQRLGAVEGTSRPGEQCDKAETSSDCLSRRFTRSTESLNPQLSPSTACCFVEHLQPSQGALIISSLEKSGRSTFNQIGPFPTSIAEVSLVDTFARPDAEALAVQYTPRIANIFLPFGTV
jgi:hypothetical protein